MEKVKLKSVIKQVRGVSYGGGDAIDKPEEGYLPVLRSNNIEEGTLNFENLVYVPSPLVKDFQLLRHGDILITASTGSIKVLGKNGFVEKDYKGSFGAFCKVVRPSDKVHNRYIKYFFQSNYYRTTIQNVTNGANINNIKNEHIDDLEIPLPPLEVQQKIANILDAADALRQNNKALVAKYDELTQALFLDMFGDPVSNPKGFELSTIGFQCNVKGGKRVPKEEKLVSENTGFPYIKAGNIKNGKVTLKDLEYLLPQTREKLKRYIVEKGDVCITVVGANIGDVGIVPEELHLANLTENANKILIKDKLILNNCYLAKYLQMDFVQKNIGAKTMAVGVPKLALFRIEQIELLIPPISLQKQYEERVILIEEQKFIAQQELDKSEELFNSLLQKAFKGELV